MSRVSAAFAKRKALIAYITAGDPSLPVTEKLVYDLEKAGADIVELGIPFSDPLADGPVIQASHQRALKKNVSLADVFKLVGRLRKKTDIPLCFMLAYNLIVQYGEEKFYADCAQLGVDGIIVPDLPPEESSLVPRPSSLDQIFLVAPTSTEERIRLAAKSSSGFVYLVSVAGITGARKGLSGDLGDLVNRVKKYTNLPVAIGFGISTPAQAREAAKLADGVIVGSAIVELIAKKKIKAVVSFVAALRKALDVV
ncbi:MAG: tryptophan synthase subunit alpha [Candidatus Margulisbacteria bacterium]|jgi:tryptophan synthase alpha chain|nr:tryptophan synthase subunit alpha [Candidatus Margulisiibacteriota bacterium]